MTLSRCRFELLLKLWPWGKILNALGNLPLLGRLFAPFFRGGPDEAIIIPIQQAIQPLQSAVLPFPLLAPLVEQASARTILNICLCRHAEQVTEKLPESAPLSRLESLVVIVLQ